MPLAQKDRPIRERGVNTPPVGRKPERAFMMSSMESPELLALVAGRIRQGVVVYDADECIMLINPHIAEIFGFEPSAVCVGSTLTEYLDQIGAAVGWPEHRIKAILENHRAWAAQGEQRSFDHNFDDGKVVEIGFHPLPGGGTLLTFSDVGHERRVTAAANRREELTREASFMLQKVASISQQNRIVAFNVRIEAARMGHEGRGLAVVADEVRDLSRQTSEVLRDVSRIIDASLATI